MIEGLEKITPESLGLAEEYLNLFKVHNITKTKDVIDTIEIYDILKRKDLKKRINAILNDDENITSLKLNNKLKLNEKLVSLCKKYNVLLAPEGSTKMIIVLDMFNDRNLDGLELELSRFKLIYKYVTPGNFRELMGKKYPKYDAIILFKRILIEALRLHATDIHFGVKHFSVEPTYFVEFRVDNRLVASDMELRLDAEINRDILYKIVSQKTNGNVNDINTTGVVTLVQDPLSDGRFSIRLSGNRCYDGYSYVCRIQKPDTVSLKIEQLGFDLQTQQMLNAISKKMHGVTFITGAIRTGKNTTAFALANNMIDMPIKMVDYSSPIETLMPFPQVDYMGNVDRLLNCVRLCKKQDINVAFINEIPDKSVAFAVRDLVNSSVHVITTLHIDRLWHLPQKLFEYFDDSFKDVLTQINGICNQKMFVKQCHECSTQILTSSIKDEHIRNMLLEHNVESVFENKGCDACNHGQVKGAVQPYVECLLFTDEIRRGLLRCDRPYQMEDYLYEIIHKEKLDLETKVCEAIRKGELHYNSLYQLL